MKVRKDHIGAFWCRVPNVRDCSGSRRPLSEGWDGAGTRRVGTRFVTRSVAYNVKTVVVYVTKFKSPLTLIVHNRQGSCEVEYMLKSMEGACAY